MPVSIAIASDHRGIELKNRVKEILEKLDCEVKDFGAYTEEPVDYPVMARIVALGVSSQNFNYGILICGTGIGMCIAANKIKGIRAAVCRDAFEANRARAHNNVNILCLGADKSETVNLEEVIKEFLQTPFEGGRHQRRLDIISSLENL
jgi:ribose 5-phosphate isomerase B